jgi:hypothetical protein
VFLPLIGPRLHGWLDDVVVLIYLLGTFFLHLRGAALAVALAGAVFHFLLTRFTNYPQGTFKLIPFRVHAFLELGEGLAVIVVSSLVVPAHASAAGVFLLLMGVSQLGAFSFSNYDMVTA